MDDALWGNVERRRRAAAVDRRAAGRPAFLGASHLRMMAS
ncbi:hypothetical protein HMPREF0321_0728 [Dermacoccus sp. Ellin185]|nr:hypothetical protein HMPREF0321_0728 [Dermacoccus sp. Ellin185]